MNHRLKKKKGKVLPEECWSLDQTIAKFVLPRLQYFRRHLHGHPTFITFEEWQQILDQMIAAFKLLATDNCWFKEQEQETIDIGLKLFAEYYQHLWD